MDIFQALADPTRRHIIEMLHRDGPCSIKTLCTDLAISRQALTKHVNRLIKAKLVSAEFRGKERMHTLNAQPLAKLHTYLQPYAQAWDQRLHRLTNHLGEEK